MLLWAVNWLVSIPADLSPDLVHPEIVSLETPLCGFMKLILNSFLSVPLRGSVFLRYSFSVSRGQSIIGLITAYITATFPLIGFSGFNMV